MNSLEYSDSLNAKIKSLTGDGTMFTSVKIFYLYLTQLAENNLRKDEALNLMR